MVWDACTGKALYPEAMASWEKGEFSNPNMMVFVARRKFGPPVSVLSAIDTVKSQVVLLLTVGQ